MNIITINIFDTFKWQISTLCKMQRKGWKVVDVKKIGKTKLFLEMTR